MTFTTINAVVQALVWTTLAGLLYAAWLNNRSGSSRYRLNLSSYWEQTVNLLQTMWMLLAIGLIISMLLFAWPKTSRVASSNSNAVNAGQPCVTANLSARGLPVGYPETNSCTTSDSRAP